MVVCRVVDLSKGEGCDEYIGRGSLWGNRWSSKKSRYLVIRVGSKKRAIKNYRSWLFGIGFRRIDQGRRLEILRRLGELKGKRLGCYCGKGCCHGDVLANLVNKMFE